MSSRKLPKISFIGTGAVGTRLALALYEKNYPIVSLVNRSGPPAIALARNVKCKKVSTSITDLSPLSDVIIIAVDDNSLGGVAKELAGVRPLKFKRLLIAHTSGIHTSEILSPLEKKGALVGSMHPVQTFPKGKSSVKLKGIYFGIEGSPDALHRVEQIIQSLDAHTVQIPSDLKALYHIACVYSSSYLIAILNSINELSRQLNLKASWTEVFGPLLTSAMENTIKSSAPNALTGPVMRGDTETISMHLKALAQHAPRFLPMYSIAGIEVGRLAAEHGKLTEQEYENIVTLFRQFIKSYPETKKQKT